MYKCLTYTVPGTGTRFLNKFVEGVLGYRLVKVHEELAQIPEPNIYSHVHAGNEKYYYMQDMRDANLLAVVGTLRDPYLSFISRTYQNRCVSSYVKKYQDTHVQFWRTFIDDYEKQPFPLLWVDGPAEGREQNLQSIAHELKAKIDPVKMAEMLNWKPIGARGLSAEKIEYQSRGTIYFKKVTFLDFAVEWYKEILCTRL